MSDWYGNEGHRGYSVLTRLEGPYVESYDPFDLQTENNKRVKF